VEPTDQRHTRRRDTRVVILAAVFGVVAAVALCALLLAGGRVVSTIVGDLFRSLS
jgi:hypothetical protein